MTTSIYKKPSVLVDGIARDTFSRASKAALVDLVADLLRRLEGREDLNGEDLAHAFVEAHKPVANARRDPEPRVQLPPSKRTARVAAVFCATHRRLLNLCECPKDPTP